eukprot:scaffold9750_cov116-Isochrysis_galbana.AAC.8
MPTACATCRLPAERGGRACVNGRQEGPPSPPSHSQPPAPPPPPPPLLPPRPPSPLVTATHTQVRSTYTPRCKPNVSDGLAASFGCAPPSSPSAATEGKRSASACRRRPCTIQCCSQFCFGPVVPASLKYAHDSRSTGKDLADGRASGHRRRGGFADNVDGAIKEGDDSGGDGAGDATGDGTCRERRLIGGGTTGGDVFVADSGLATGGDDGGGSGDAALGRSGGGLKAMGAISAPALQMMHPESTTATTVRRRDGSCARCSCRSASYAHSAS